MFTGKSSKQYEVFIFRQLDSILSEEVKAQDRSNAFSFLFSGDRGNGRAALPFIIERIDDIRDGYVLFFCV